MRSWGIVVGLVMVLGSVTLQAEQMQPQPDPIGEALIPPELLFQQRQALGVTDAQAKQAQAILEKAQQQFAGPQNQLQREITAFTETLGQGQVDQKKALAQLENVLQQERTIKRTQISLLIQIKNLLTPEQQAKAQMLKQQLKSQGPAAGGSPPESLQRKVQRIQTRLPAWIQAGGDQATLGPLGQQLDGYLKTGNFQAAEGVADQILQQIGS